MTKSISYAAVIAAISLAAPAFAQTAAPAEGSPEAPIVGASGVADQDAAASATGPVGATAPTGAATNTSATVSAGMNVKDSTGATIGQVTEVKADASGGQTATIKMGADTFAVGTSSLAVQDGAAVVNASQAELQQMLKK